MEHVRISVKAAEQAQKEFRRNQQVAETAKKKKAEEKRRKVRTRVLLLSAMLRSRERENQRVISDSLRLTRSARCADCVAATRRAS